jgi:PAS domain S-box-containing protein
MRNQREDEPIKTARERCLASAAWRAVSVPKPISPVARYTVAVLAIAVATVAGWWLKPFTYLAPFFFYYPAIILAVWLGGLRPGLVATVLAAVTANRFFLPPYDRFSLDAVSLARTGVFAVTFASICWLAELARLQVRASASRQKLAEEALHRQFSITHAITATAADAMFMVNTEGRTTFTNPAAESMFGYKADELLGKSLHDAIHHRRPDGSPYPMQECPFQQVYDNGVTLHDHEDMFFRKDGSPVQVSCSNAPVLEGGRITAAVLVVRDISQRKQVQEELSAIYESAPVIMMLVDRERRVRKANKFAEEVTAASPDSLIGLRTGEALRCVHTLDDPGGCGFGSHCQRCTVRVNVLDTLFTGRTHNQVEANVPFLGEGQDQQLTVLLSTTRLDVRGEPQVLVTIQDITARKRAEEALRESEARFRSMYSTPPWG